MKKETWKLTPEMNEILDSLVIEQNRAQNKINNYLRQTAVVLGLDPDRIEFNGPKREFTMRPNPVPEPPALVPVENKKKRKPQLKEV